MRRPLSVGLHVVGSLLLTLGLLAGVLNHNVLDVPRLTSHVDAVRADPHVSRQVGELVTDRVIRASPDLVALRPLLQSASTSLVASSAFGPVVRSTTRQLAQAMLDPDSDPVVLRLADAGAVVTAAVRTVAPQAAARLPADLDVVLARIGGQTFPAEVLRWVHLARLGSWLLPLLALLCFAGGVLLGDGRRRGIGRAGVAVMSAGGAVLVLTLVATGWAAVADTDTLGGALRAAIWGQLSGSMWWTATAAIVSGSLLCATSWALLPELDLAAAGRRVWAFVSTRPASAGVGGVVRGLVLVALGVLLLLWPGTVLRVIGIAVALVLLNAGLLSIAGPLASRERAPTARERRGPRPRLRLSVLFGVASAAVLVAVLAVGSHPADTAGLTQRTAADVAACNGSVRLCNRPYDKVAFPATHNSMAAASDPGWFIAEQPVGIIGQLDAGVRVFLIDTWYGQQTNRRGVIATSARNHAQARREAVDTYGPEVVASALRVRHALNLQPRGPEIPYLCHGLCEIGATRWEPVMAKVHDWLEAHPRQVVTFFIQDVVSPADTARVFQRAGLLPMVATPVKGRPWPTLGQMIDSGKRVVVLMENHGGGRAHPWLLQGFDWVQDTPYTNPTQASLSCARERGEKSSPLLLINYWLANFRSSVTDAEQINRYAVLRPFLRTCQQQRGMIPNYVAVNHFERGDLFRVVDRLNRIR